MTGTSAFCMSGFVRVGMHGGVLGAERHILLEKHMVGSINSHRKKDFEFVSFVLSSFRFSLAHTVSFRGHDARIAPLKTDTLLSEINRKSDKAN